MLDRVTGRTQSISIESSISRSDRQKATEIRQTTYDASGTLPSTGH